MLYRRHHQVARGRPAEQTRDRQVVSLGAPAGKDDVTTTAEFGDVGPRRLDRGPRCLTALVHCSGIGRQAGQPWQHSLADLGRQGCGGVVIEVNTRIHEGSLPRVIEGQKRA